MDVILFNKGSSLNLPLTYQNQVDNSAIDLTDKVFEISEAYPSELMAGEVNIVDALLGTAEVTMTAEIAAYMKMGQVNWFRISMLSEDGSLEVTPKIWVKVQ